MSHVRILVLLGTLIHLSLASFCGESAIPFSFEALPNGKPILGCARPTCFGWSADGKPFSQNAQFYSVNKTADGFVRKSLDSPRERIAEDVKESFQPQIAECELTFESDSCPNDQQWVGGIAPMKKVSKSAMMLQCCSYNVLKHSTDRGVATVHPGEIVIGGEVFSNGRQYAFDYIADIRKMEGDDDKPVYDVTVRRFPCLPIPDEQSVLVDNSVMAEMERRFYLPGKIETMGRGKGNAIAFQAPIETFAAAIPQPGASQQTFQQVVAQPVQQFQPQLVQDYAVQMYRFVPVQQAAASAPPPKRQGGAGEQWCFSNDMKVQTAHNGIKRMDELKVDDWVLSEKDDKAEYVPVKSWIHRLPEQKAEFLKINLADGNLIKLTRRHFVYKAKCVGREKFITLRQIKKQAVWAEKVHPGDCLFSLHPESKKFIETKVLSVEPVNETGIYAPLTENGKLLVNGVLASCHTVVESHRLQRFYFQLMEKWMSVARTLFGRWTAELLFGPLDSDQKDIPFGVGTALELLELVMPKNIRLLV